MVEFKIFQGQGTFLKRAVAPLVDIAEEASVNYSPEGLSLIASDTSHLVTAALHIQSSGFTFFRCREDIYADVNLEKLYQILNFPGDDDSITLHCDAEEIIMAFVFEDPRTRQVMYYEMLLTQADNDHVDVDELQYEYKMVVGIPSKEFRRIIMHLGSFGETVSVTVMDTQVKFSAENEEIVLSKKNDECIIWGAADDDPIHLLLGLYHKSSFLNASLLSRRVWILYSDTSPTLLNCPVAAIGNIKFYFV